MKDSTKLQPEVTPSTTISHTLEDVDFAQKFPPPDYDSDVRAAYKGGFTWLNPKYEGKVIGKGMVLDVNSLYPSVMYNCNLPYGEGVAFHGKYEKDDFYPLYVQMLKCDFHLKKGYIPTIQIKNDLNFVQNEYVTSSNDCEPVMVLTNIDLQMFLEHYEIEGGEESIEWLGGWKFMAHNGFFNEYIDRWMETKMQAEKEGNKGMRQLAKLMLNSLYGKFGVNPNGSISIPENDDGKVSYAHKVKKSKKVVYLPVACFVTAWARYTTITSAQKCYDRIIYCDTDSMHLRGWDIPPDVEIDPYKLGAWKIESKFDKAKFLRQKCYLERIDGKIQVKCAGMPKSCHSQVTFDNFNIGQIYTGKLRPVHTKGGVVLQNNTFRIKPKFSFTL